MAEVWLARAIGVAGFEKLVVLKTILPHLVENPTFVSMFVNEGRLAAMLSHPNCVQIFDLGQEGGTLFLAMEYIEGFSLSRLLKRAKEQNKPPSEKLLARIIMDAASGLDYAHRLSDREGRHLKLVHRDVSPDNLLISFSGQTKVVDFGIAKAATPALLGTATVAGTIKGKHGFIAPEYLLGDTLDGRADVFALGVVTYRALTRKRPFTGDSDAAISLAVVHDVPKPPHEVVPSINPALSAVVMMALEKEPAARFESARAMRQALEVAVGRAADPEDVADYMNELWPPGDPERLALHTLANGGASEEMSGPALQSVVSGTWGGAAQATPHGSAGLAGVHATPPTVEEMTRELLRPPVHEPPPAAPEPVAFVEAPAFDPPPSRRGARLAVSALALVLVGGGVTFLSLQGIDGAIPPTATPELPVAVVVPNSSKLRIAPPVPVKVFDGKDELGTSPLDLERAPGTYTLRLVNKALGVDQSVTVILEAGGTASVEELAKGNLSVKVEPWASVKVDGKQLGQTPVLVRQLYEGVHVVELSNANLHETRRLEVKVKGGETKTISLDLEAE